MFDPFDHPGADHFSGRRFSGGQEAAKEDAYALLDAGLASSSQVSAARRAEKYRKARQKETWAREDEIMRRQMAAQAGASRSGMISAGIGAAGAIGGGIIAAI